MILWIMGSAIHPVVEYLPTGLMLTLEDQDMNRHHREEHHKGHHKKEHHKSGGHAGHDKDGRGPGLIGERPEKTHSYEHAGWHAVDKMLMDHHPTTHMGTVMAAGGHMGHHHHHKEAHHSGRHGESLSQWMNEEKKEHAHMHHAKKGGHMSGGYAQEGAMRHSKSHADKAHGFAAGGVGKVRKGQY